MKLAAFALSLVAASAFAGEGKLTPVPAATGAPRTVSDAVQRLRALHASTPRSVKTAHRLGSARPNVIQYETSGDAFIIPAAGSVQGSNGTFFRSDVTFANYDNLTRTIGVGWMAQGQDNSQAPLTFFALDPLSVTTINDFVGTGLKVSGLGGLIVLAFDSTGQNTDPEAFIDGFSRIWTPQPGSAGTVSQSFPAVSLFDSVDNGTAVALGLRIGGGFRTNVGIVNLDSKEHTWTVTSVNTGANFQVTVKPFSLSQPGAPAEFAGTGGNTSISFDVPDIDFTWSAYASSVDNVTGDGWVARATQ